MMRVGGGGRGGEGVEVGEPCEGLEGFAEAHVVCEDAAAVVVGELAEEVEAVLLVRAELG